MPELTTDFKSLPEEYQQIIRLAQDLYKITVAPLQLLVGGWSGAVVYLVSYRAFTFGEFFSFFITDNKRITSIGALSLLANAVLFTIYINTHRDNTAKGIFLTTVIYGIGILVLKILN